jgi:hypothetical protein
MPLDRSRADAVAAVIGTLATFAADLATVELDTDIEIAGVFVP